MGLKLFDTTVRNLRPGLSYERIELKRLLLSHTATLFLLQGGSIKTLMTDVYIDGENPPRFMTVAMVENYPLWDPPSRLLKVVLAHLLELPTGMKADEVAKILLEAELV